MDAYMRTYIKSHYCCRNIKNYYSLKIYCEGVDFLLCVFYVRHYTLL